VDFVAIENVDTYGHFVDLRLSNLWTLTAIENTVVHKIVDYSHIFMAIEIVAIEPGTMEPTPLPLTT